MSAPAVVATQFVFALIAHALVARWRVPRVLAGRTGCRRRWSPAR